MNPWRTAPISPTCERLDGPAIGGIYPRCDLPTAYAYPSQPYGWMALCEACARTMRCPLSKISDLISSGERFEGGPA